MAKQHHYQTTLQWTGNEGTGTSSYKAYNRNHDINVLDKMHKILGSSDPSFLGDRTRYNPEELLVASLSACHMLWYLHLCAVNKIVVTEYVDAATGTMEELKNGSGKFTTVTLHPKVKITDASKIQQANELHHEANTMCFIANSCNFPIHHQPETIAE